MIATLCKHQKIIALFLFDLILVQSLHATTVPIRSFVQQAFSGAGAGIYQQDKNEIALSPSSEDSTMDNEGGSITATKKEETLFSAPMRPLIGGPGQPEMSSFKSVNSNNMVDLFSGDFSYNIPLLDVGGYPVNIHYSSGVSMDQEASWVGLGWNINPGVIGRATRGLPDDFNGTDSIIRSQSIKRNKTVGVTLSGNPEVKGRALPFQLGVGAFHNNYNGWGTEAFINASINAGSSQKGPLSGSLSLSNNSQTGLNFQPSLSVRLGKKEGEWNGMATLGANYNSRAGIGALQLNTEVRKFASMRSQEADVPPIRESVSFGMPSSISFATPSYLPTITMPMTNSQFSFKFKVGSANWTVFTNASILGYVSESYIQDKDKTQALPAYGYLYFSKPKSQRSLLDFNREKEVAFNAKSTPHIPVPQYTYDVYSISGEGITGSFRPYRGDVGYIYDHAVSTRSENSRLSAELGFSQYFHGGVDFDYTTSLTKTGEWTQNNNLTKNLRFLSSDSTFEEVYFRNPGEKSINSAAFYSRLGGDSLISVKLSGEKTGIKAENVFTKYTSTLNTSGETLVTGPLAKDKRDKRSQVISYYTAGDASKIALDTIIRSYKENANPLLSCNSVDTVRRVGGFRKPHHLSEIDVLNPDGRRYVYGLPAYNISQEDVVFSVAQNTNAVDGDQGLTTYGNGDNSLNNTKGKESYYTRDKTPAHAHSFLLTGILSQDYVDVKGDGITEDDLGDAVKFNYTQVYGDVKNNAYNWRTPSVKDTNKANYNEGLKTYNRDDKGMYLFGSKEVWYLNSIESKTMVAVFKVSNRNDVYSAKSENGGFDTSKALRKLDSIELFSKADIIKNGLTAKPVKTVHFEYEVSAGQLCKGVAGDLTKGKLTLKKIWFTYNANQKGQKNPYLFYYHPGVDTYPDVPSNPSYNAKQYDRWGNFKDPLSNPGGLNNIDYPYSVQDSAKAASYASVWHLTDIKLPSGGKMHVTYESDDYGFVQNKRAVQMFQIAGFGSSTAAALSSKLYEAPFADNNYVFVNAPSTLGDKKDVYKRYLQGLEDRDGKIKLYFRIAVRMPYQNDSWSTATKYEMIPTYAEVENYGLAGGNRFWLQLKTLDGGTGVLTKSALQFLRLNLPSKAYPSSEIGDNVSAGQVVKTLGSAFQEIKNSVDGFDDQQRRKYHCQFTEVDKSFVRLGNPGYKKYGGGLRVKRIEIFDNWNAMTGQKESVYGQEYTYTTNYVRGAGDTISISSGVAAYEPMLGGEENPFHLPIEYTEKLAPLAPSNYLYTETPLGESFFPSPMIGYSKVRVRTINAKAKSANGWTETEHFTTKDFPTLFDNTPIDKRAYNPKYNILKVNAIHHLTVSQGFRVELNDMNGKVKSEAIYAENDPIHPIRYTANFYKVEDDLAFTKKLSNTVWAIDSASGHISKQAQIGKEVEILVDVREQTSTTLSNNLGVNVDVTPLPFIPPFLILPSAIPLPQREESRFRSVAVTKVVQRYGILDSVVVMDKGSVVSTKNLVFDGETGQVLVSRTNNAFNDPVYNFQYPARWAYTGMGMAYENLGVILSEKKMKDGRLVEQNELPSPAERFFESGDELWLLKAEKATVSANTATECGVVIRSGILEAPLKRLWAINASKGKENHKGIYFIDEAGKPYTGIIIKAKVIRSGKRNLTDAYVGALSCMISPVKELSATEARIVIDESSKVLNASTATYKDLWRVENTLYQKDSCYTKVTSKTVTLYPTTSLLMHEYTKGGGSYYVQKNSLNTPYYTASLKNYPNCSGLTISCRKTRTYRTKSILKFDFAGIPTTATVTSATLDLYPKRISGAWSDVGLGEIDQYLSDKLNAHYVRDNQDARSRTNTSLLQRVRNSWNISTPYANVSTYPEVVTLLKSGDDVCESRTGLLVKDLVQPMITSPQTNYGMLISLQDDGHGNKNDYQFRAMSFCTGQSWYSNTKTAAAATMTSASTISPMVSAPSCADCFTPTLTLTYSYQKDTCVKLCRNNITDTTNPYRWGILGNWRTDKTTVYYSDRSESDASQTTTNVRTEGTLKNFTPYWTFTNTALSAAADTTKWVWNSASNQYNRKGVEIENYDPLGRFNAGLYGYNQTLPVAVAQNSQYREMLFDGFEDYGYRTRNCDTACSVPREIDFVSGNAGVSAYSAESHTGKYSLLIPANGQAVFSAPVVNAQATSPNLSVKIDSLPIYITTVNGKGTGLNATYSCLNGASAVQRTEGPIDFIYRTYTEPFPAFCGRSLKYKAMWTGKLQPKYTEAYTFYLNTAASFFTSSGAGLVITDPATDAVVLSIQESLWGGVKSATTLQALQAGKLYNITVTYPGFVKNGGSIQLSWSSNRQQQQVIPKANLYPVTVQPADTVGSVIQTVKEYCIKANSVVASSVINPRFSPYAGKKMIVGAWMKVPATCDNSVVTAEGQLLVSFNTGTSVTLQKTGLPVEGWQRYESEVVFPANATQVNFLLKAGGSPLLVDDIRVHPYSSNLKSFVYDPVSLRLMSELDENNYASFYEYDDDGTLTRVKKETERGVQTIKETRSVLLKN